MNRVLEETGSRPPRAWGLPAACKLALAIVIGLLLLDPSIPDSASPLLTGRRIAPLKSGAHARIQPHRRFSGSGQVLLAMDETLCAVEEEGSKARAPGVLLGAGVRADRPAVATPHRFRPLAAAQSHTSPLRC